MPNTPRLVLITSLVLMMSLAGCIGKVEEIIDESPIEDIADIPLEDITLPVGWDTTAKRSLVSPQLVPFTDCNALEQQLKQTILEEARIALIQAAEEQYMHWGWAEDGDTMESSTDDAGAPAADSASGGESQTKRTEGEDFSGTNNQETGVDEADFIKTDGYNIYILDDGMLKILGVPEFGQITMVSEIEMDGYVREMMLGDDSLVVLSTVNTWSMAEDDPLRDVIGDDSKDWGYWWRSTSLTKLTVVDISNRSIPEVSRELYIEGYYMTAREVDDTVRMVNHGMMDVPGIKTWLEYPNGYWELDMEDPEREAMRATAAYAAIQHNEEVMREVTLADLVPQVYEKIGDEISTHVMTDAECNDFIAGKDSMSRGITSIMTLDLSSDAFSFQADHLVSNWPLVYASSDVLLIAEQAQNWWWYWGNDGIDETTNIHSFDIGNDETTYTGSGRINGTVLDQFCLSEHNGTLRVASTTGQWNRWWMPDPDPMENHVYTLQHGLDEDGTEALVQVGHVGGIAEGERIWSARFVGDMGYVVTFEQIDPLWTIDLSDPTNPTILGELEVPGVSTYIHPLGDGHLLTIGIGPMNDDGTGLDWSKTRLSLFDASNASNPTLVDILNLTPVSDPNDGWTWGWSEATYEHKAFQYWGPKEMLAVPMTTYRYKYWYDSNGDYQWKYHFVSKLVIVNVSAGENLTVHGEVDHSDFYTGDHHYWSNTGIRRSIFMGDYIYAISHAGVSVTNLTDMSLSDSLVLVEPEETRYRDVEEEKSDGGEVRSDDDGEDDGDDDGVRDRPEEG